jgi:hypothetical protein
LSFFEVLLKSLNSLCKKLCDCRQKRAKDVNRAIVVDKNRSIRPNHGQPYHLALLFRINHRLPAVAVLQVQQNNRRDPRNKKKAKQTHRKNESL